MACESELVSLVAAVKRHVDETRLIFSELEPDGVDVQPIPFFGDPREATVATLGVNPSATEFSPGRRWPAQIGAEQLTERLLGYFDNPAVPAHGWFDRWQQALGAIGAGYHSNAFHTDLSPRATPSLGSLGKKQAKTFQNMVETDVQWLCALLEMCPRVRLVLAAGAVTGREYIIEFLTRVACTRDLNIRSTQPFRRVPGKRGNVGIYDFSLGGCDRRFFFCASGPSDRRNPHLLLQRVREHANVLTPWI